MLAGIVRKALTGDALNDIGCQSRTEVRVSSHSAWFIDLSWLIDRKDLFNILPFIF